MEFIDCSLHSFQGITTQTSLCATIAMFNSCPSSVADVNKMPLGKLSRSQIAKGLEALLDIEEAIKKGVRLESLARHLIIGIEARKIYD